jgi:succinate-semialdehyde dehydrogenase/glutarate-semialdehyde dehydrogenase
MLTSVALSSLAMSLKDSKLFRQQCYVGGAWVNAGNGGAFPVTNPVDGSQIGTVPSFSAADTQRAIDAAEAAFPAWRAKTAKERSQILRRWFDLCMQNQDDLAMILTLEQGKPLAEARGEIAYGSSFIEWFAEEAKRVYGDVIPPNRSHQTTDRCGSGHHSLEFPQRNDHSQRGSRSGRRLHRRDQAR